MSYKKYRQTFKELLLLKLSFLPELSGTIKVIKNSGDNNILGNTPDKYIEDTIRSYFAVLNKLSKLNSKDIEIVKKADEICLKQNIEFGSASKIDIGKFLSLIGKHDQIIIAPEIIKNFTFKSNYFNHAIEDLSSRMAKGHELALKGLERTDGASPEVDYSIWGFTKGLKPRAMIHFILCHLLERLVVQLFKDTPKIDVRNMIEKKDFFRNALGQTIRLMISDGSANFEISRLWATPRDQGGLQWHRDPRRQVIFNKLIKTSKSAKIQFVKPVKK